MTLTVMDKEAARTIQAAVQAALAKVAADLGLDNRKLRLSYDPTGGSIRVSAELALKTRADGLTNDEAEFRRRASMMDLEPDDFGTVFRNAGADFRLVNFAFARKRYPIVGVRVSDGKRFFFPVEVLAQIKAAKAAKAAAK